MISLCIGLDRRKLYNYSDKISYIAKEKNIEIFSCHISSDKKDINDEDISMN